MDFGKKRVMQKRINILERDIVNLSKRLEVWQGIATYYRLQAQELRWDIADLVPLAEGKPFASLDEAQQRMITLLKYRQEEPAVILAEVVK